MECCLFVVDEVDEGNSIFVVDFDLVVVGDEVGSGVFVLGERLDFGEVVDDLFM